MGNTSSSCHLVGDGTPLAGDLSIDPSSLSMIVIRGPSFSIVHRTDSPVFQLYSTLY